MANNLPFFICTTERTGSYLLMDLIKSTGVIEILIKLIADIRAIESTRDEDWLSFLEGIPDRYGIDFKKRYGAKLYSWDLDLARRYLHLESISPLSIKWIWLRRKNKMLQAISYYRATQIDKWHFWRNDKDSTVTIPDMDIPVQRINTLALQFSLGDNAWEDFFRDNEIEPYMLFYEDFENEDNWKDTILSILEFLEGFRRSDIPIETRFMKSPRANLDEIYKTVIERKRDLFPDTDIYKLW